MFNNLQDVEFFSIAKINQINTKEAQRSQRKNLLDFVFIFVVKIQIYLPTSDKHFSFS